MVQTEDQYQFCYRAALEYLSSFDTPYPEWHTAVLELGVWNRQVILRMSNKPLPPYVTFRLNFPACSGPPTPEVSPYEESVISDLTGKPSWNNFVINLNGGPRKNSATASVITEDATPTPISPPYVVAPSFEMRWPGLNGSAADQFPLPAFQLTSHKQLEQADQIMEVMEDSDESPPYLPAVKIQPTAPPMGSTQDIWDF